MNHCRDQTPPLLPSPSVYGRGRGGGYGRVRESDFDEAKWIDERSVGEDLFTVEGDCDRRKSRCRRGGGGGGRRGEEGERKYKGRKGREEMMY